MPPTIRLGLGGGCHWCTEAIFSSVHGISHVQQGWLASIAPNNSWSEGILLSIDCDKISLKDIIDIHLDTHSSSANHSMRKTYRSAIYVTSDSNKQHVELILASLVRDKKKSIVTQVLPLKSFKKQTKTEYNHYYYSRLDKPFCKSYINPKLKKLINHYPKHIKDEKRPIIIKALNNLELRDSD